MCFFSSAWGRIDGPCAFIENTCLPASTWNQKFAAPRRPGLAGARQTCALRSSFSGRLGSRSERSQPSLSPSTEVGLIRANPPMVLQYRLPHTYTPRLCVRPSQTPSPRRTLSFSLSLSLSLCVCFSLFAAFSLSQTQFPRWTAPALPTETLVQ